MDRLWGEFLPVPPSSMVALSGGERVEAGGRRLDVAYTPGHAVHHVSYFSPDTGVAFVGDTAGIRLPPSSFVLPPTPPPDIDLDAWRASLDRIGEWRPDTVFLTHFGPWSPSAPHLTETADHLDLVARVARTSMEQEGSDEAREASFVDQLRRELRRRLPDAEARAYETAAQFDLNWRGLERYWRRQMGR
jgi:glyoxylase-like metal-dependent hydrolase (beta-lactamase superfamily II)